MEQEERDFTCPECGHTAPFEEFQLPEEMTFVSWQCPECGADDL